jgi:hypothetical protein
MRVGRILAISVVGLASIIVAAAAIIAINFFVSSRETSQQNFVPAGGRRAVSPVGDAALFSKPDGNSSFLFLKNGSNGANQRLTAVSHGIESEPSFSRNGKLVVYSFANSPDSKSEVWTVSAEGQNPHPVTGEGQDALHPIFSPDGSRVFYAASSFTGHYSPVVRPARHDWDLYSIPVQPNALTPGAVPTRITHASFYDLRSLDIAADTVGPGGTKLLISTTGYPIGALLEEFVLGASGRDKIFQPHVPGEPRLGATFGEARFIHDGMDILFLAATETPGQSYDYNVYSMSDVTGADIKQLTHLKGMTTELTVLPDGKATFVNGGVTQLLDIATQTVKPL